MDSFLLNTADWPKFADGGRYCVVRREVAGKPEHGFITPDCWSVNLGYVWDGGNGRTVSYDSAEEMLADGWQVD